LHPNSRLRESDADAGRECTLELVDPVGYRLQGQDLPLETDVTAPLAHVWSRTDLGRYRCAGLLRAGEASVRAGLMLLRPAELRHYTFFRALPFVKRVVFLATPHRGSELSRRPVGRLGSNLIAEPDHYYKLLNQLLRDNPDAFNRRKFRHLPTSIDTLEPNA